MEEVSKTKAVKACLLKSYADFGMLLAKKTLPKPSYSLAPDVLYYFYFEKKVYGLYSLRKASEKLVKLGPGKQGNEEHQLQHVHNYKPLRLHHVSQKHHLEKKLYDSQFILNLLKDENKDKPWLQLRLIEKKDSFTVYYAAVAWQIGIQSYEVKNSFAKIQELGKTLNRKLRGPNFSTEDFLFIAKLGEILAKYLISPRLEDLFITSQHILLQNETSLPLQALVLAKQNFIAHKICFSPNVFLNKTELSKTRGKDVFKFSPRKESPAKLASLSVLSGFDDSSMHDEMLRILNKYKKEKNILLDFSFGEMNSLNLLESFSQKDIVHIISHAEVLPAGLEETGQAYKPSQGVFTLLKNDKPILSSLDLQKLKKAPKFIFLTSCFSDNIDLLAWFFLNHGKTAITASGEIAAYSLPRVIQSFYWHLFTRASTLRISFANMMRKLSQAKDPNFFMLKMYGLGDEKIKKS